MRIVTKSQTQLWLLLALSCFPTGALAATGMTTTVILGLFFLTVVVVALTYYFLDTTKCPKCERMWAGEPTGNEQEGVGLNNIRREMKCKYCGHLWWRSEDNSGG